MAEARGRHGPGGAEAMRIGRMAVVVVLGALLAAPVAYAQFNAVLEGAGLVATAFAPAEFQVAGF